MEREKPILCMEHCKDVKIFGFDVPQTCSKCGENIQDCELRIPPFRVPSPFREAKRTPCAVVLKPTVGDFLTDYKNFDNLHIGLTSSHGLVYEFDSDGLKTDKTDTWNRCLTIRDLNKLSKSKDPALIESWNHYWDFTLDIIAGQRSWAKERYHEKTHNCYSFVLCFLRALQTPELSKFAKSTGQFCQEFIIPKTSTAAKYITLYRRLVKEQDEANKVRHL